uniref:Neurexin-4 n=1 Tax=Strigamia maritima TaxID=126957 RepID=T1JED8_STRMM
MYWILLFLCLYASLEITHTADCDYPLVAHSTLKATSSASASRGPDKARLDSQVAWTAGNSDFGQYLIIDLGQKKNITSIATQGRPFYTEYVQEYRIEFGNNGLDFSEYKDTEGNVKLFRGNVDGDHTQQNYFETPIIAQWVRINPTRWHDRISMRVELYGCEYHAETINFDGMSVIRKELRNSVIMSSRDYFRLRFKTNKADGILVYSRGTQGDLFALQIVENQLLLNIDLGAKLMTSISVGSLLDDNLWHDVLITRNRRDLTFTVDRVLVKRQIRGDFTQLDLNREMFIGGVLNFNQEGLIVTENFTGCIENLFVNHSNIIAEMKENPIDYWRLGVVYSCIQEQVTPVTFKTRTSHLKLRGYEGISSMNISVDFRTFDADGLLVFHKFLQGYVEMLLIDRCLQVTVQGQEGSKLHIKRYEILNDGKWHKVMLILAANFAQVNIDDQPSLTKKSYTFKTGPQYLIAGGVYDLRGFVGCMRSISVDGNRINPSNVASSSEGEVVFDSCQMIDKCNPNPCEHDGTCHQTWETFTCNCNNTGYGGAVCHTSLYGLSCEAYRQGDMLSKAVDIKIDVDGSGDLPPFLVTCEFPVNELARTYLGHKNERTTIVNGFETPGSFIQDITYNAEFSQITQLINRSISCRQHLAYECFRARLLNSPVPEKAPFRPFSWWVSRSNQPMDYWGGSLPGSRKCQCGLYGQCSDPNRWCNCDSFSDKWQRDEGLIEQKEFLPVRQLRIGDTGTPMDDKQGKYTLGKLICEGDNLFEDVITFTLKDAVVQLPRFDWGHSADIYFQFKTTVKDAVLLHSQGPTDYIKVSIQTGNTIQFSYFAGNSIPSVTVTTASLLADNRWHSVLVERNRKEARILVDGSHERVAPEPLGPIRAIHLTSNLVVGATVDYREGYVGCMRSLLLNGQPVPLQTYALKEPYGLLRGCVGKCESSPCLNNGTCWEEYNKYTCDCRYTAFKGPICADEIGVWMRSDMMIQYDFEGTYKSTIAEKIRIGFTTTEHKGMLLGLFGHTGEYFNLMMSTSGEMKMVFDFGFERQEMIYADKSLADGQSHDVRITRSNNGLQLNIKVDNYQTKSWHYKNEGSQDVQFNNLRYLFIGRNHTMNKGDGFVGCISRVEFDDVYPLKLLFQEERPANIYAHPANISEDYCGIDPVTYPPETKPTRIPNPVDVDSAWLDSDHPQQTDTAVLGGVLALIFIALVIMAILIGRYAARHKGEYRTHEDMGAQDAPDADTAIVQGQTGHDVSKKKECLYSILIFLIRSGI